MCVRALGILGSPLKITSNQPTSARRVDDWTRKLEDPSTRLSCAVFVTSLVHACAGPLDANFGRLGFEATIPWPSARSLCIRTT